MPKTIEKTPGSDSEIRECKYPGGSRPLLDDEPFGNVGPNRHTSHSHQLTSPELSFTVAKQAVGFEASVIDGRSRIECNGGGAKIADHFQAVRQESGFTRTSGKSGDGGAIATLAGVVSRTNFSYALSCVAVKESASQMSARNVLRINVMSSFKLVSMGPLASTTNLGTSGTTMTKGGDRPLATGPRGIRSPGTVAIFPPTGSATATACRDLRAEAVSGKNERHTALHRHRRSHALQRAVDHDPDFVIQRKIFIPG